MRCMAADRCRAVDERGNPAETDGWLCFHCLESAERDVRALVLDYRDLEQHLPPSLGVWGDGLPRGTSSRPLPLNEHVLNLQHEIWWLTDAWDAVVRDASRLSDKPPRTRAGWAVQQSVAILAPRLDVLAAVTSVEMWDYPGAVVVTDRCSPVAGWQGVLDLAALHRRARSALGLSNDRPALLVGVRCRGCDVKSKLTRDHDSGEVWCRACGQRYTAEEYTRWTAMLVAEQQEDAA